MSILAAAPALWHCHPHGTGYDCGASFGMALVLGFGIAGVFVIYVATLVIVIRSTR